MFKLSNCSYRQPISFKTFQLCFTYFQSVKIINICGSCSIMGKLIFYHNINVSLAMLSFSLWNRFFLVFLFYCFGVLLCVCVFMCVIVYVQVYVRVHVDARGQCWVSSPLRAPCSFVNQGLSLNLKLSSLARLSLQVYIAISTFFCGSSFLWGRHFANWAIS